MGDGEPATEAVLRKDDYSIAIHYGPSRRIDFEYWSEETVRAIAGALAGARVGEEFVADRLAPVQELFVHRLLVGRPLCGSDAWNALRERFDAGHFRGYLTQQEIHRVDGAMEDVAGMVDSGDLRSALLRARDVVGHATAAYAHACGNTNPLVKWRARIVERLPERELTGYVRDSYTRLTFGACGPPDDRAAAMAFVEDCARYSHRVVGWIQG